MIFICIILILILTLFYYKFNNKESFTYIKCNKYKLGKIQNIIINNNNFSKIDNSNWNLYLPCGYKSIEYQLKNLNLNYHNKYIFGISGSDKIASKNNLWKLLQNKYSDANTIMPQTYILDDKNHMNKFLQLFDKNKIYILKKNLQRKKGIKLVQNDLNFIKNASKDDYKIVQEYISKPFLVNNYKLNIRIFLLIIYKNKKKHFYLYKNGKCLYTANKYNASLNLKSNITSYTSNIEIYNKNPFCLNELKYYMEANNINYNNIWYKIMNNVRKLSIAIKPHVCNMKKLDNVISFQLFGLDVILDSKLNPLILEINKGPNMFAVNDKDLKLKTNLNNDIYSLVGILKSKKTGFIEL